MRIASLHTYPVKGCHRLDHDEARVEPWGLAGDRRWMIVDAEGVGVTQRDTTLLTRLTARPRAGGLHLSAPGMPDIDIPEPTAESGIRVRVFRDQDAVPARLAATTWVAEFLGRDARLVWQDDPTTRSADGDSVNLADGYPLLLAGTASLDALNDRLLEDGGEPVPIHRFRPNIVITGAPAWAEDDWTGRRLRIGEHTYRVGKPCARCRVTTIDQETGETGRQPLHVLGRYRRFGTELHFAVNLVPDLGAGRTGTLRTGDTVTLVDEPALEES
ncbi:MOSC N-terminal beta barrel domain-containing protein [Actinoplanes sp. NPDC049802]|uniref:MOSC domain-containing protein n=1 Tax=Actinoplanes sp. NPDC049802 TaxID=3154742 RepID=UPI0033E8FFE5